MQNPSSLGPTALRLRAAAAIIGLAAVLPLGACVETHPSPTIVVPQGAQVVCPGGRPAVYDDGAYHC
jgi:hypothetical protein